MTATNSQIASVAASASQVSTSVSQLRDAIHAAVSSVSPPGSLNAVVGTPHISTDATGVQVNAMGGSIALMANGVTTTVTDLLSALDNLRSV